MVPRRRLLLRTEPHFQGRLPALDQEALELRQDDNNALSESAMRISYKIFHDIAKELKTFNEGLRRRSELRVCLRGRHRNKTTVLQQEHCTGCCCRSELVDCVLPPRSLASYSGPQPPPSCNLNSSPIWFSAVVHCFSSQFWNPTVSPCVPICRYFVTNIFVCIFIHDSHDVVRVREFGTFCKGHGTGVVLIERTKYLGIEITLFQTVRSRPNREWMRMMMMRKGEGETRCRHVAYSCRIASRGPPGLTSPSDGRITINSDICLLFICTAERFGI
ncbi:hypothetical protein ANN_22886 [Periplaneta americana]|uniref:Uncharacterized protein n=1 Tax=Periplaneta americana TaxID=6978 RepID=A0ABQ8SKD5_PERAM|nr:hypothetical protein ANN_22886 [Periplaneta americana]